MNDPLSSDTISIAQRREKECLRTSQAMQARHEKFWIFNWLTVILPALLVAAAGANFITEAEHPRIKWWTGVAVFGGSMLVIIHKALKCDEHQAELTRLRKEFHSLAAKYRTVHELPDDPQAEIRRLDSSLAELRRTADPRLPDLDEKEPGQLEG